MPHDVPWRVKVQQHPGSTGQDIQDEPDWTNVDNQHRVGFRNRQDRLPGLTHDEDSGEVPDLKDDTSPSETEEDFDKQAEKEFEELRAKAREGELVNFRDIIKGEKDLHLRYPQNRSLGWRYVLETTEDWVKQQEPWPANIKRRKKEEQAKDKEDHTTDDVEIVDGRNGHKDADGVNDANEEFDWKRKQGGETKHHDAYAADDEQSDGDEKQKGQYQELLERCTPQEIALLRALQHERDYRKSLKQNDGKRKSPQTHNRSTVSIDEQDQFSPDNWLPRSEHLIRLTGKHPLNAEAKLTALYEGGLITPNELHYVRNHGAVPRLLWECHELDVENGKLVLPMDNLKNKFEVINIPVSLACDGNRRKELNMVKNSKGFSWGAGATGCVYWKGPLLRDVLLAAGVQEGKYTGEGKQRWVNFQGADDPSEGKYETCIPLDYAMDPTNDVLLAYEMNDVPLPPDHGYPIRLLIPGYVGGRCVKWLKKVWITDYENDSHYHIWDNRVLPSFITEKDGDFATTMFNHPDTACNEQNLNSVVVKPAQGEKIPLTDARRNKTYRIEGYAYDGGGHEVQRVEVSLDGGETWLYCIRRFPDYPIRHGNKFWTWLHWHVDISIVHMLQARSICVRAWNVFRNTQPERPVWNTMGMMNNCWYTVKPEISQSKDEDVPHILFRHPCEPGTGNGGWMEPSEENTIASAKQEAGAPQKQFTRQEFGLPDGMKDLGLGTCQHIQLGFHLKDKMVIRSYTPTKPLLPDPKKSGRQLQPSGPMNGEIQAMHDGHGTFELVVKTYFPNQDQPGGAMSNILDCVPIGEEVEVRGPTGEIVYNGNGKFVISDKEMTFKKINLVLGGSGLTPGYALIARALLGANEDVQVRVVDANSPRRTSCFTRSWTTLSKKAKGGWR